MKITTKYFASIAILLMAIYGTAFTQPPETEPPSIPSGLAVIEIHNEALGITWNASTDNTGVQIYGIYVNGINHGYSMDTEYIITDLSPNTAYNIAVSAYDIYINESGQSASILGTTTTSGIRGRVFDSGVPLPGILVELARSGTTLTSLTDINGNYYFPDLLTETYIVEVGVVGYEVEVSEDHTTIQDFRLNEGLPVLHTYEVTSISGTGALCGGQVYGVDILDKGVVWSITPNITVLSIDTVSRGPGDGDFVCDMNGYLSPNTTYYLKAWARNSSGIGFGQERCFYTGCNPIILNELYANPSSCGASDGSISIQHDEQAGPYTYAWTGPNGFSAFASGISGLEAGIYELTVTDKNGCETVKSYEITDPPPPAINNLTETICDDGSFTITPVNVTDGVVPPGTTYSWGVPVVTGGLTGGVSAAEQANISGTLNNPTNTPQTATYTVTPVSGSCTGAIFTVTVTVNPTPAINNLSVSACEGIEFIVTPVNGTDGSIPVGTTYSWGTPSVTGGLTGGVAGSGQISIHGTLLNPTNIAQTATYTVTPHSGSCTGATFTVTVTIHTKPAVMMESMNHISCYDCIDGAIAIIASGGSPPYEYTWTGPDGFSSIIEDISNLTRGLYTVTLTDQNMCTAGELFEVGFPLTVTKTSDYDPIADGPEIGTLRYAMDYANSNPGLDSIAFDIEGDGPFTIYPERPLPIINESLIIDGYSQNGSAKADENTRASLMVEINGFLVDDEWGGGLGLADDNSTVRGMMINGFDQMGILISGSSGNVIEGNHIGIDMVGDQLSANYEGCIVIINSSNNIIGGDTPAQRNVMAGVEGPSEEDHALITIQGNLSENNIIKGNYLGVNAIGQAKLGSAENGIYVIDTAHHNTIGPDNVISGLQNSGISLLDDAHDNTIIGNKIGTNSLGNTDIFNWYGIHIKGSENNIIGGNLQDDGTLGPEGNVISGNRRGIYIQDRNSVGNLVQGNIVGLDVTGKTAIGNSSNIILYECLHTTIGGKGLSRNIIAGEGGGIGILSSDQSSAESCYHKIIGNYIGTDITGTDSIGGGLGSQGILVFHERNVSIGGSLPGEGNLISGYHYGIEFQNTYGGHRVQGNFIGTDYSGSKRVSNRTGIFMLRAKNILIGGPEPGEGNLISGNGAGITFRGEGDFEAENILIQGNYIGTDLSGQDSIGNWSGINILETSRNNLVGGIGPNEGNLIAFNNQGIYFRDLANQSLGNSFLSNSIHSNSNLGINLYGAVEDGVTANDPLDADDGPNGLQNYPDLDTVTFTQDEVNIAGSMRSVPGQDFLLQFFVSPEADETGYGEGKTFIGSDTVRTNDTGYTNFHLSYPTALRDGLVVTATATDTAGNTSEFSNAIGGAQNQEASGFNMPMHYVIHEEGIPFITDSSDFLALHRAFGTWDTIITADLSFIYDGPTIQSKAVANDGINLITFMDETYFTTSEVLGLAAKTLRMDDASGTAEIVDADIVFNPYFAQGEEGFSTDTHTGVYDLQSIATHEIGHTFGMIHSGVLESTMFFAILENRTDKRTLEVDDISWASFRYPKYPEFGSSHGFIKGNISYGDDPLFPPVGGALIVATNTSTGDAIHAYSDENGDYKIPVPAGNYKVAIEPLDGNVHGYYLTKGNISYYIDAITVYTDFPEEYYNFPNEGWENDDPTVFATFDVIVADTTHGIDLVTNKDLTPPQVVAVTPKWDSTGVSVMTQVFMGFSEQVDINTFVDSTCYLTSENGEVYGNFVVADNYGRRIAFTPKEYPLDYGLQYTLHITEGVTDLKGNGLDVPDYTSLFTTEDPDEVAPFVTDMIPDYGIDTVFTNADIMVFFSEPMDVTTTPDGFSVAESLSGNIVHGEYAWDEDLRILTFNPGTFLAEGTSYTVSVTKGLEDLSGNPLVKDSLLVFLTVPEANPEIIFVGPGPGQDSVSLDSPLVIDFTEPIDPLTVNTSTVQLLLNNTPLTGSFKFLFSNSRVIFRPDQLLLPETTYDVLVTTQIRDVSDEPLPLEEGADHRFLTAATVDVPFIDHLQPSSGVAGTMVTIGGKGIDPNPDLVTVRFGDKEAAVLYSESTYLTTKVPAGASKGMVTIQVGDNISNEEYFYVPPINENPGDEIRRVVGTQSQAEDVEIEPDAAYAYITNSGADAITRLNMVTFQVQSLAVGQMPVQIDIHPNGDMAYVSNHLSHDVSVIDLDKMEVVQTIAVGINPYGLVVSPNGDLLLVANTSSEDVLFIDVDQFSGGYDRVVRSVNTNASNTGIDMSPDAGLVLIACEQGILFLITDPDDPAYNTINRTVNTSASASGVEILPDAGMAVAFTENNYLEVIGIVPGVNYGKILGGVNTRGSIGDIDISPDGQIIYVTHPFTSEVSVYQIEYTGAPNVDASVNVSVNLELINVIEVDDMPYAIAADPRGERVLIGHYTQDGQVTEIDVIGSIDAILFLEEMIESVIDAISERDINSKYGGKLLVDLEKTLSRYNTGQLESAIDHLDNFIDRVSSWIDSGDISEDLGNAWLEAAYRIREQLIADLLEQESLLKGTSGNASDTGTNSDGLVISNQELLRERALILQNQPNPFSQQTRINFAIPEIGRADIPVVMRVFNTSGQVVRTLVHMDMEPGIYSVNWSGSLDDGGLVPDGIYLLELSIPGQREVLTISVIR